MGCANYRAGDDRQNLVSGLELMEMALGATTQAERVNRN